MFKYSKVISEEKKKFLYLLQKYIYICTCINF